MIRACFCLLLAATALAAADKPNRDILELQREVAQLGQDLKAMQQAFEARLTAIAAELRSAEDANAKTAAAQMTALQALQEQSRKSAASTAEQGLRLDQFAAALTTMQQAIADLNTSSNRIQTQIVDVGNAVKVIQIPSTPPKPAASDLLKAGDADRLGAKYELAVQDYTDFLKYYADAPEADTALFGLGMTHTAMNDFESAARDFDTLAAKYPDSKRVPEALFYKFKSFQSLKRATDARAACTDLRKKFPTSDFAKQCAARP